MIYRAFCEHFDIPLQVSEEKVMSAGRLKKIELDDSGDPHNVIARACAAIYDVARDDSRMRAAYKFALPTEPPFDRLRKTYVERDEFSTCKIDAGSMTPSLQALGFL